MAEALDAKGAQVTAIDVTEANIGVAEMHAKKMQVNIDYRLITAEELVEKERETFDVVACLEVIEHVPDPGKLIQACSDLLKPNPLAPTRDPATINTLLSNNKPAKAAAIPDRELSKEITTGISPPPIGITNPMPAARVKTKKIEK